KAIGAARERALTVVGFTGRTGGEMAARCDICLHAPSDATPLIQQIHITAGHIICGLVEGWLFPRSRPSGGPVLPGVPASYFTFGMMLALTICLEICIGR